MAPVHSVSREHQPSNWLIRVLGLSIVVCSVFSIIQVGTVTTLTMSREDKRVMRNGLIGDNGLVLAIEKSPDNTLDAPVRHRGAREDELYSTEEDSNLLTNAAVTPIANAASSDGTLAGVDNPTEAPAVDNTPVPTSEATVTPALATTAPDTKELDTKAPETKEVETQAPETKTPETKATETKERETKAPDSKASDTMSPETQKREKKATEKKATVTKVPDTKAPDTKAASKKQDSASGSKKSPPKPAVPATAAPSKASSTPGKTLTPKPTKRPIVPIPEPKVRATNGTKGIVMCLHDRIIPLGISLIRELRCLGNEEVIEVYHCNELSAESINLFHAVDSNTKVIDICSNLVTSGVMTTDFAETFKSYWIKPLVIHQTELEEIILLDADDILMKDPATLRQNPGYVEKGTLFFYDRVVRQGEFFNRQYEPVKGKPQGQYLRHWFRKFDYARFNSTAGPSTHLLESFAYNGKTCHEQDSSMLLINKKDNAKAMSVLWFLITEERFRYTFSWGDKEAFWLSYEFSQTPYYFSPWGASVVSSTSNDDMGIHPETLCGSLAHYAPVNDKEPELLYINGKALVDPVPFSLKNLKNLRTNQVFNMLPTHMAPRQSRVSVGVPEQGKQYLECMTGLGATPVPEVLKQNLWRRRMHFMAISMNLLEPLQSCSFR